METPPIPSYTILLETYNLIKKETLAEVFSCEFCEISKNTFFTEYLRATASERYLAFKDCGSLNIFVKFLKRYLDAQKPPSRGDLRKKFYENLWEICSKFVGEHPCRSTISIKLQNNFIEITLWHECLPVNLLHIFRTSFLRTRLDGCFCIDLICSRTS